MEIATVLSIVGLLLALIELWVPKLSNSLEKWMTALVSPLLNSARALKNTPALMAEALDGFTKKTWPGLVFVGLPSLGIVFAVVTYRPEWAESFVIVLLVILFLITSIPLALSILFRLFGGYIAYPIYALAVLIASPAWFIKLANKMGNGKGVSGIGLILAFYGVLSAL